MGSLWKKPILSYFLLFFLCFLFKATQAASPPNNNEIYTNTTLGFSIRGPAGWFLEMKDHPSPQASPFFQGNSNLFAIFSQYDLKNKASWPANTESMLLIFLTPPNHQSAMEKLNESYTKINSSQEKIIESPREVKFNNQIWAVGTTQIKQGTTSLLQFTYLTVSPKAIIHIEAVTTEQDYDKQKKLFDEVVSHTIFNNDSAALLMQSL